MWKSICSVKWYIYTYSAAFDTINHEILLHRLSLSFGFSGVALRWFTSYLSLRTQSVKVNDTLSKAVPLIYGVPQGSVLGPILFTLYTTPLSEVIQSFKGVSHHLYADDTQIYTSLTPRNANSNLTALQKCVAAAQSWMTENRLKLNPDKTEFLLIGTPAKRDAFEQYFPLDILGSPVSPCKSARNLGVLFDSGFTFSNHISAISRACYANIRILSRVRRYLSFKASKMLASALVSSRLDYCNSLLASCTGKDLRRLQILQNILCRVVCRLPWRARVSSSMKSLHWLPIRFRINFKISVIVYKTLQSGEPKYLKNSFTLMQVPKILGEVIRIRNFLSLSILTVNYILPPTNCPTVLHTLPPDFGTICHSIWDQLKPWLLFVRTSKHTCSLWHTRLDNLLCLFCRFKLRWLLLFMDWWMIFGFCFLRLRIWAVLHKIKRYKNLFIYLVVLYLF